MSDCPSSVKVSPSSGPYKAGDVLTCMSDGYPQPSYQWTDSHGQVVSNSNTTTLLEGWFFLTCTATGNFSTTCSASETVTGFAAGKYGQQTQYDRPTLYDRNLIDVEEKTYVMSCANKSR